MRSITGILFSFQIPIPAILAREGVGVTGKIRLLGSMVGIRESKKERVMGSSGIGQWKLGGKHMLRH
jgi:hypothetical protein